MLGWGFRAQTPESGYPKCMEVIMKPLLQIFLLFLSGLSHAVPYINQDAAVEVLNRDYAGQWLYWKPVELPLAVLQTDKSAEASYLSALFEDGMVTRERQITTEPIGNGRKRVVLSWLYDWQGGVSEGTAYGRRRLHSILTMTDPIERDGEWFVEIHLRWYADQLADWTSQPEMKKVRRIRRALESRDKPFEATVYLVYRNYHWQLWRPDTL